MKLNIGECVIAGVQGTIPPLALLGILKVMDKTDKKVIGVAIIIFFTSSLFCLMTTALTNDIFERGTLKNKAAKIIPVTIFNALLLAIGLTTTDIFT